MPTPPQYCPSPRELDDLELLVGGALAPTLGFNEDRSPVTLHLPDDVAAAAAEAGAVELVDPEGLPLARVTWPTGRVERLAEAAYGPFRNLHLTPAQSQERHGGRTVVPVTRALTTAQVDHLRELGPVLLLALTGRGTPSLSAVALIRTSLAAARLHGDAAVVVVPLASHGDPGVDHTLRQRVAENYAGGAPVVALVDDPGGTYSDEVAAIVAADRPTPDRQGLVLFFTGLSGSGKSTLARALVDRLLEQGVRTVTSLDGDVVRRNLSAGLSFSKADRETNIRRIGWVAAEIARHGGVAVVSPIAPFDETRQQVRAMVEDAGGAFFLVHVATPLQECERRDRKGLYAKARAGEIPEFTGISSPYEVPQDADVRVDTTGRSVDDALDEVLAALRSAGYLDLGVGELEAPLKVLFVCTANICRSPAMELLTRSLAGSGLDVSSAGTRGFVDHPIDDVVAGALPDGIDPTGFRSRPLTSELLAEADLVVVAESAHRSTILEDHPALVRRIFTLGQLAGAVELAPAGLAGRQLVEHLGTTRRAADPELDVADPYRRGPDAARAAVGQIESLLRIVVTRLTDSEHQGPRR